MRLAIFCFWCSSLLQAAALLPNDVTIVETVLRMQSFDLASSAKAQGAVNRYLDAEKGSEKYFELLERFEMQDRLPELIALADDSSRGIKALKLALKWDAPSVQNALADDRVAPGLMKSLAMTRNPEHTTWVEQVAGDEQRSAALRAVARELVSKPDARSTSANTSSLPEIPELMKKKGAVKSGEAVFARACAICHKPSALNIDFGPNLSEIGDKLPREDLFLSILEPSAAISMGFEGVEFKLKNGGSAVGLIGSETDEDVTVLMMGGIKQSFNASEIAGRNILKTSLMPPGLHATMSAQELVDLVAYLQTLKKK